MKQGLIDRFILLVTAVGLECLGDVSIPVQLACGNGVCKCRKLHYVDGLLV